MSEPSRDDTTPVPVVGPAAPAASGPAAVDEPAERGALEIAFSVVRRIAEYAADSTEGTVRTERRVVGVGLGESGATAKVSGYGDQVDLRLEVPLAYPAPIALTVEAVRGNVRERVETLTGYGVRGLDVTVSALTVPAGPPAPTRRTE
ncbi:Asp23/Gls24 family envelope stress response protein [Actinomycetospora sp. TBRC 11914]|uniref:Asp23/Gls24 family envelope stress response protein n=1 Tax=Actinomycetospora sp. TBRC 11914 TaxID=2729387 RepID=UPI00145EE613|nr:Asp23/Gls24 family envelope stress response protein [Actinomycetospora sp. TBRC 11914]NMO90679.1 Asp23/Gls24 family envelope stress response protein [Actinomycetospora sp. TBRC 11914]